MIDSEKVAVESPDKQGARLIEELTSDILSDLDVAQSLNNIRIFIDPDEPVFVLYGKLAISLPDIKISDIATMTHTDDGLKLDIKNERYVNDLLDKLVTRYGKANILQLDRYTVPSRYKDLRRRYDDAYRRWIEAGYQERTVRQRSAR